MEKRKTFENPLCMRCDAPLEKLEYTEEDGCITYKCPNCGTIEIFTPCEKGEEDNYAFFNESVIDDLGNEEHGYHGLCPQCGSHIIWGADFMRSEVLGDVENEDDDSLASSVSCPHCGANIQIIDPKPSEYKLDIVIPCVENDLPMLTLCVDGIRNNVIDEINNIYVVAPYNDKIKKFCTDNELIFVDENTITKYSKETLNRNNNIKKYGRSGWVFQQLLKLNGDKIATTDNFLIIDSDHVLLKNHKFYENGKYNFYMGTEYHAPYFLVIDKLFNGGYKKNINFSFITDKMLFNKDCLKSMKSEIEECCGIYWEDAIINNYYDSPSGFSEFETYGTYVFNTHNKNCRLMSENRYMSLKSENLRKMTYEEVTKKYSNYDSVTELKF